ncbi:MAG: hypothetical protein ABIK86_01615 [candidate division WOR-3 bacterium]
MANLPRVCRPVNSGRSSDDIRPVDVLKRIGCGVGNRELLVFEQVVGNQVVEVGRVANRRIGKYVLQVPKYSLEVLGWLVVRLMA